MSFRHLLSSRSVRSFCSIRSCSARSWLKSARILSALAIASLLLSACANTKTLPKADARLTEVDAGNFDYVLMMPGEKIPALNKIYIEAPQVSFSAYWLTEFRGDYTERDLERITTSYARLLTKALTNGITEDTNIVVVESAADADVIFRPLMRELNIYAPDLSFPGRTKSFIREAGNAVLDLTLIQASDNKVIAQFIDNRETASNPGRRLERTERATNARYFRRLMERWTNNLTDYLIMTDAASAK